MKTTWNVELLVGKILNLLQFGLIQNKFCCCGSQTIKEPLKLPEASHTFKFCYNGFVLFYLKDKANYPSYFVGDAEAFISQKKKSF